MADIKTKYLDLEGLQLYTRLLTSKNKTLFAPIGAIGSPSVASTVAEMVDHSRIYVYTGSESGYVNGDWYYWNGSAWESGGSYNSAYSALGLSVENGMLCITFDEGEE